jgi:hypothetical protein
MRAYKIFAAMPDEQAAALFRIIKKQAPAQFAQSVQAACAALKSRPSYILKQPFQKQVAAVRRALSRVAANPMSQETLAVYFLECRKPLLVEWLDAIGVEHEDGILKQDEPQAPPDDKIRQCVEQFRSSDEDPDRDLLLKAFAAQDSVNWPVLDSLLEETADS